LIAGGRTRFYFHRTAGKNIALPGLPWSPTFMAAYEAALNDGTVAASCRTKTGTVDAAMLAYLAIGRFRQRSRQIHAGYPASHPAKLR
jgi:hypothetical protein